MTDNDADVLIVGAGIAGAALACALRNSGLRVLLVEKSDEPLDTARGDHLQPRTCDILAGWGVLDALFEAGAEKRAGAIWYDNNGMELLRSSVFDLDLPHPYFAFLNHERIAEVFLETALKSDSVSCIRPIRNWWIADRAEDRVTLKVGLPGGQETRVSGRALIGADGRGSRVSRMFEFASDSTRYERSIGVFFAHDSIHDSDRFLRVYLGDTLTTSVIPRTGPNCKIGIPMQPQDAASWRRAKGGGLDASLQRICPPLEISETRFADVYPPVRVHTDRWVSGSAALIGDACHAMHPARSQGMNIAIRCINAMAEKLSGLSSSYDQTELVSALVAWEDETKPGVDRALQDNHEWGLRMDRADPDTNRHMAEKLVSIQSDSDSLRAYSLASAGYPPAPS